MKLLGILEIENKTDILAFSAFIISFLNMGYNIINFVQGSYIDLIGPKSAFVGARTYKNNIGDEQLYIVIISTLSYVNKGSKDYSAIVVNEKVNFRINNHQNNRQDRQVEQDWHNFVEFPTTLGVLDWPGRTQPILKNDAAPFVIPGGDSKSHETFFAPRTLDCSNSKDCDENHNFVSLEDFIKHFERLREEKGPKTIPFKLTLTAEVSGEGPLRGSGPKPVECILMIRLQDLEALQNETLRYFWRPCHLGGDAERRRGS